MGLILCNKKNEAVAHYALEGLSNILAVEYQTTLPDEKLLATGLERTRTVLESQRIAKRELLES